MPELNDWRSGKSTRRRFIKTGAVGGTVAVAGCIGGDGGDGDGDGDGDTEEDGDGGTETTTEIGDVGEVQDERFRVFDPTGFNPTDRHFNPWNPEDAGAWHPGANVFDKLAVFTPATNEAYPLIAESWEMEDETTLFAELSDEWTWHDGTDFIAEDWAMQAQIEIALGEINAEDGERAHQVMESVEAPDDYSVRVNIHDPLSEVFAVQNSIGEFHDLLGRGVFTKHDDDQWSEWHSALVDGSDSERSTAAEEITTTKYPMIEDMPPGHGPFQLSEVGDTEIVMELYEDHPNADTINFREFSLQVYNDTDQVFQAFQGDEIDAAHSQFPMEDELMNQLPDTIEQFREVRSSNNLFTYSSGHVTTDIGDSGYESPLNSQNVRKAVSHIYDRQSVSSSLVGVKRIFEYPPCRVPHASLEQEEGQISGIDIPNEFTLYGENDTERATELLEEEGYYQEDGEWYTPDDERFEISFMNGAEDPHIQGLRQDLQDFGIAVEQENVDDSVFNDRRHSGDYDIMPDGSSANGIFAMWALSLVPDWIQSISHFNPDPEITPVGEPDSDDTKQINIAEHINQWMQTDDDQYHQELMWWWNQHLPEFEVLWEPDAGAINTENWELIADDAIYNGVDDALYVAPKLPDGTIEYTGD